MAPLIAAMTLVTFGIRYIPLALLGRLKLSPKTLRVLSYVPVAVLTAITVPMMIMPDDKILLSLNNAYLIGGIIAGVIAWRTNKLLPTIVIGMAAFFLWQSIF